MATGNLITTLGRKIVMHRTFEAAPTYTAPLYFKVGTGTTTPALGDTALSSAITIGGNPTKAVVSGYPTFDDANLVATTRCLLLTTECNGNNITEFGLVNSDGTPKLFSRGVFPALAKTSDIQMIIVEKDLIE